MNCAARVRALRARYPSESDLGPTEVDGFGKGGGGGIAHAAIGGGPVSPEVLGEVLKERFRGLPCGLLRAADAGSAGR